MNVIDVALKISIIANRVFPKTPLPNSFFTFGRLACRPLPRWIKAS
jgi:hypothetical protein